MITDAKLDAWIKANVNVLISGFHGVGKSERVIEAMHRNKKKFLYFSASTMDPFVDFIGVPRVIEENDKRWLEFIQPQAVAAGDAEYIIIDEFNRGAKKIRNALMEIMQFKTMNGIAMPNLKAIWGMINPADEDDTYDVDKLDPAQQDRFQIQVAFPAAPDRKYFEKTYDVLGKIAVDWWQGLGDKVHKTNIVSPRRLSYVIKAHLAGLDISDTLPTSVNATQLKSEFNKAGYHLRLDEIAHLKDSDLKEQMASDINLRNFVLDMITSSKIPINRLPLFDDEEIGMFINSLFNKPNQKHESYILKQAYENERIAEIAHGALQQKVSKMKANYNGYSNRSEKAPKFVEDLTAALLKRKILPAESSVKEENIKDYLKQAANKVENAKGKYQEVLDELLKQRDLYGNTPAIMGAIEHIIKVTKENDYDDYWD